MIKHVVIFSFIFYGTFAVGNDEIKTGRVCSSHFIRATPDPDALPSVIKVSAWSAAPHLFPETFIGPNEVALDQSHRWAHYGGDAFRAMEQLLNAQVHRAGRGVEVHRTYESGDTFPHAIIATHVRPQDQAEAAALLGSRRFKNVPHVLLTCRHAMYAIRDPGYTNAADLLIYTDHGNLDRPLIVDDVTLIGGFESLCLNRTLNDILDHGRHHGLKRMAVRVLTDHTYFISGSPSFRDLRDGRFTDEQVRHVLAPALPGWRIDRVAREPGQLRIEARHWRSDFAVRLTIE